MTHFELAQSCQQIYSLAGVPDATEIGGEGAFCSIIPGKPTVVVFRGTRDLHGWVDDLDIRWAQTLHGPVHHGFSSAWESIRKQVLREVKSSPVILTGHSLGGAIATLAAADINTMEVVTFGCPRVGGADFAECYGLLPLKTTRYVYRADPVPMVLPMLAGYRHVCDCRWEDGEGWQDGYDWPHVLRMAWHMGLSLLPSWVNILAWVRKFIAHHHIDNYLSALKGVAK